MAKRIFAEGTIVDELVGLGILAGMITVDPERRLDPTFQEALKNTAGLCGCPLGEYASKAAQSAELDGEIARLATREMARDCVKSHLSRTAEFLVAALANAAEM